MKTRKERVAEFMSNIDNLSTGRLRVACYVRKGQLPELNDMAPVIAALKEEFAERPESWIIDDIAGEYNCVANMSDHNLQIWANYRRNCNADAPIANADGSFINVSCHHVMVNINGIDYFIGNTEFAAIDLDDSYSKGDSIAVSYAVMEKLLQIKKHWNEIKRLVE